MPSPLISWWGLVESARQSAFVTTPGALDSPRNALIVLSRGQHDLQDFTNAVRRSVTVSITGTGVNGVYSLPFDIKQPLEGQFTPAGSTTPFPCDNITPEGMDRLQQEWNGIPIGNYPQNKYYFTLDLQALVFFPPSGVTGTFWMRYLPHMHEYQPSNLVGDWSGVTEPLSTWMQANGPQREFWSASGGFTALLAMDLMEKYGTHRAYPERFAKLGQDWERSKAFAERNKPLQQKNVAMPHLNGPLN